MPKILEINGFKFYLYSNDHLHIHVHVWKGGAETKIVLRPELLVKDNYGFKSQELRQILSIVIEYDEFIVDKWHEIHDR